MTDTSSDRRLYDHLWDPAATPSPEVVEVAARLASLRFDPVSHPLRLPRAASAPRRRSWLWLALPVAATLVVAVGIGAAWRWSWPSRAPWPMALRSGGAAAPRAGQLAIGQPFRADSNTEAVVDVARIGTMRVAPGSEMTLRTTEVRRHRLVLARGEVDVRVWAPSGWFAIQTPAGEVIDMGCVFRLRVDADGTTHLAVETGWVQLENFGGEVLVPAGASSEMRADAPPLVPLYDAADPRFRDGLRAAERTARDNRGAPIDLGFLQYARPADALSLILLSRSLPPDVVRPWLARTAALLPPPPGVSIEAIANGNRDQLWKWYDALDLPPAKAWWLNWRDAFRR